MTEALEFVAHPLFSVHPVREYVVYMMGWCDLS
jgi:hypothetical protein